MPNKEIKRKRIGTIEVKLKGEVYSRRYAIKDVQMVVDLVNQIFENEINIKITDTKKNYKDEE